MWTVKVNFIVLHHMLPLRSC